MKIFLTVGTQLPFDRLVGFVDAWAAGQDGDTLEVFGQIGPTRLRPQHFPAASYVTADECLRRLAWADVVVAHAGMGSILTALDAGKPVVVLPRQARLGEHRNDHQAATVRHLRTLSGVWIAEDESNLPRLVAEATTAAWRQPARRGVAGAGLIAHLSQFVHDSAPAPKPARQAWWTAATRPATAPSGGAMRLSVARHHDAR